MCDEAVDDSLAALKLITDWFVTSKMIKNLYTTLHADKKNEGSGDAVFSCNEMGTLCIYLNNINLGNHFDEDNPDTIILVRIWFGILNL